MGQTVAEKVQQYMDRQNMLPDEGMVCVAVSGGADSVCLLRLLTEEIPDRVCAVHINHKLRGAESDADEDFVAALCDTLHVPLYRYAYQIRELAEQWQVGTEEAGRRARQQAYADCVKKHHASCIAVAHHANDQAETMLFRLARGSSLAGLAGIRPVQQVGEQMVLIRPLLVVTREEIEAYLQEIGQNWREDVTNQEDWYARNAIRHQVMPALETHVNKQAVLHIREAAEDLEAADAFLRREAAGREEEYLIRQGQEIILREEARTEPPILQGYIFLDALEWLCGSRRDLGKEQIGQLRALFQSQTGKRVDLPYGLQAVREYEGIRLYQMEKEHSETEADAAPSQVVPIAESGSYLFQNEVVQIRIFSAPQGGFSQSEIPAGRYTKWFDYDTMRQIMRDASEQLCLRTRREKDWLYVTKDGGKKRLKDFLIDAKIPQQERDRMPLLTIGSEVLWILGDRRGEEAKVTNKTMNVLEISIEQEGSHA